MKRGEGKEEVGDKREEIDEGGRDGEERKDGGERRKEHRDASMGFGGKNTGRGRGGEQGGR